MKSIFTNGNYSLRLLVAIALLSLSIISYQLILIHYLSIVQWYHFAYMVISIAMLGFGASGTVITVYKTILLKHARIIISLAMISSGVFMALAIRFTTAELIQFDSYLLFVDQSQIWKLSLHYFIFFTPFFMGAFAIGIAFVKHVDKIGTFYFADMVGAGIGGMAAMLLFYQFSGHLLPYIIAVVPIVSGLLLTGKGSIYIVVYGILALCLISYFLGRPSPISISDFKSISYSLNLPEAEIVYERSSPYGLIQVVESPALRHAPGLSLSYTKDIRSQKAVFNNGNWVGVIPYGKPDTASHITDYSLQSLPYRMAIRAKVLVLNAGSGEDIFLAVRNNAKRIIAIEPNRELIRLSKHNFASDSHSLFYNPSVEVIALDPRTYISKDTAFYDLITLPTIGAFGGGAGLFAMKEEFLMTTEAFGQMWEKLTPDGAISVSAWMQYPARHSYKLIATIYDMLEQKGVNNLEAYVVAIRNWNLLTVVVKKSPISVVEQDTIRSFCSRLNFDLTIITNLGIGERSRFNDINDPVFFDYLDSIGDNTFRRQIYDSYSFRIQPATDDKPYFSQFIKWQRLSYLSELYGTRAIPFFELGYLVVVVTLIQLTLIAFLLIVGPLVQLKGRKRDKIWVSGYFLGLGIGYMFLEMVFIQQFTLYLGHTIFSAAFVLSVMLISSGIGSYYSGINRHSPKIMVRMVALIAGLILCYSLGLEFILKSSIGFHPSLKLFIALTVISLPSYFMGFPFPLGLKMVSQSNENLIPWAWCINGAMSVVSAGLAIVIAVELGFKVAFLIAAAAYGISLLAVLVSRKAQ